MTRPNQVWATDITYVPKARGFVYLAIVAWFTRHGLAWQVSSSLDAGFCIEALSVSVRANLHDHFSLERHLVDRKTYKLPRSAALAGWESVSR